MFAFSNYPFNLKDYDSSKKLVTGKMKYKTGVVAIDRWTEAKTLLLISR